MKKLALFVLIAMPLSVFANDGGIEIVAGSLVPVNIETVSMDYERLTFTLKKGHFDVEVHIELNNHEGKSIEPLLAFEFALGSLLGGTGSFNFLEKLNQFILLVNGADQKFELGHRGEELDQYYILLYKPTLNPGLNTVYHKFQMPYGYASMEGIVSYILTTGSRWKNGVIGNLEIFIRTEFNTTLWFEGRVGHYYRDIVRSFDTIGQSKLYYEHSSPGGGLTVYDERYSLTPNGYLYKNLKNFVPDRNIEFQAVPWHAAWMYGRSFDNEFTTIYDWSRYIENGILSNSFRWYERGDDWRPSEKMLEDLSADELRILRNTLYAMRGYVFNDPSLNDHFNRQYWYFPNPNIAMTDIALTDAEQQILHYIIAEENRRR